jgi:hypothetical protein
MSVDPLRLAGAIPLVVLQPQPFEDFSVGSAQPGGLPRSVGVCFGLPASPAPSAALRLTLFNGYFALQAAELHRLNEPLEQLRTGAVFTSQHREFRGHVATYIKTMLLEDPFLKRMLAAGSFELMGSTITCVWIAGASVVCLLLILLSEGAWPRITRTST